MKKKVLIRALLGAPGGLAISTFVTIIISLIIGDGQFHTVPPELVDELGGELNAVLAQTACAMIYGAAWGGASAIWENENWSLLRQTVTHLVVCSASALPIAWLMHWIPRTVGGFLGYCAMFFAIYGIIWASQYLSMKKRLQQINAQLDKQ